LGETDREGLVKSLRQYSTPSIMANPRQRRKSRAGNRGKPTGNALRRIHNKLNRAPTLKGPEVLQQKWDKRKTVFQNYAALGLLPSIPLPNSKPLASPRYASKVDGDGDAAQDAALKPVGFGRIIRDDDGNVIDIILPDDDEEDQGEREDDDDDVPQPAPVEAKTDIVRTLESISATAQPVKRHTSTSEREWLRQLVQAHGDDTQSMSMDRKLNVWQKTPGELKKMLRKAGGVEKLRSLAASEDIQMEA